MKRLIHRLGLYEFDQAAPFTDVAITPQEVRISLRQHVGAPAIATVSVGDEVARGQLIGDIPEKAFGAAVHASIDGRVTAITADEITIRREG